MITAENMGEPENILCTIILTLHVFNYTVGSEWTYSIVDFEKLKKFQYRQNCLVFWNTGRVQCICLSVSDRGRAYLCFLIISQVGCTVCEMTPGASWMRRPTWNVTGPIQMYLIVFHKRSSPCIYVRLKQIIEFKPRGKRSLGRILKRWHKTVRSHMA